MNFSLSSGMYSFLCMVIVGCICTNADISGQSTWCLVLQYCIPELTFSLHKKKRRSVRLKLRNLSLHFISSPTQRVRQFCHKFLADGEFPRQTIKYVGWAAGGGICPQSKFYTFPLGIFKVQRKNILLMRFNLKMVGTG